MAQACQNDDVAEYERVYSLGMLENHPPRYSEHLGKLRALVQSRGWHIVPEPHAVRLVDKTGTARAYVAFDDGPGYIEWAASSDGQLVDMRTTPCTTHPGIMWLYVRDWLESLPQGIRPALGNTGALDALPNRVE